MPVGHAPFMKPIQWHALFQNEVVGYRQYLARKRTKASSKVNAYTGLGTDLVEKVSRSIELSQTDACGHRAPQFTVIHTVRGFDIVNEAEVDAFLELSCFFPDPVDVGNLISGSSAFSPSQASAIREP